MKCALNGQNYHWLALGRRGMGRNGSDALHFQFIDNWHSISLFGKYKLTFFQSPIVKICILFPLRLPHDNIYEFSYRNENNNDMHLRTNQKNIIISQNVADVAQWIFLQAQLTAFIETKLFGNVKWTNNESMEVGWKPQIVSNNTVDWIYPYKGAHDQYTLTYTSSFRTFAHRYYLIWIASNLLDRCCHLNKLFVVLAVKKKFYVVFAIRPAQSLTKTAGVGDSKLYCSLWWMESDEVKSPQNTSATTMNRTNGGKIYCNGIINLSSEIKWRNETKRIESMNFLLLWLSMPLFGGFSRSPVCGFWCILSVIFVHIGFIIIILQYTFSICPLANLLLYGSHNLFCALIKVGEKDMFL